jgi:ABC-type multidrug transport system fused ATPase/permease subunit
MDLNTTLELLSRNWVGTIASLLGLIVSVITGVGSYLLTRQRTRLAYRCDGKRLLDLAAYRLPTGITVHYRGQGIPRLTRTRVSLLNDGEKTISGNDIVASDPLRLKLRGDSRVLAATVLKTKRDVCEIKALPDASCPSETHIRFDFLDAGDGAVIEILHTSEESNVEFLGTVRGLPQGLHNFSIIQPMEIIPILASLFTLVVFIVTITTSAYQLIIGILAISFLAVSAIVYINRRRYPKYLHIEELS